MQEQAPTTKPVKQYNETRARRETRWVVNSLTQAADELRVASAQLQRIYAGRGHLTLGTRRGTTTWMPSSANCESA